MGVKPDPFFDRPPSPKRFPTPRLEHFVLLLVACFLVCAITLPTELMMRWANSIMLGIGVAVLTAYVPGIWRDGVPYNGRLIIWGVVLTWAAAAERRLIDMIWWPELSAPIYSSATEILISFLSQQVLFTATLGGLMHVTAPGAFNGVVPDRNWALVGVAAGIAIAAWTLTSYW